MSAKELNLSWKFLNSTSANRNIEANNLSLKLSNAKFQYLNSLAKKMNQNWKEKIKNKFGLDSGQRFVISAGNMTSAFVLPNALSFFASRFPRVPILAVRLESAVRVWSDELLKHDVDLMICVLNVATGVKIDYLKDLVDFSKIKVFRNYVDDKGLLVVAKSKLSKFDKDFLLKNDNILFGRIKPGISLANDNFYSSAPKGREKEQPKIISEHYFMSYLLMEQEVGIWHTFNNSFDKNKHAILDDKPLAVLRRHTICKADLAKKFNCVSSKITRYISQKTGEIK